MLCHQPSMDCLNLMNISLPELHYLGFYKVRQFVQVVLAGVVVCSGSAHGQSADAFRYRHLQS